MSKFFVGQRVRVVRPLRKPESLGEERRIEGFGFWPKSERRACDCTIRLDDGYVVAEFQLEPILPDGHRAGDLSFSELMDKCRAGEGVAA